jgi:competence protein ComEC
MKKILLWILIVTMFIITGCSYIEHTQGAGSDKESIENDINNINNSGDREISAEGIDDDDKAKKSDVSDNQQNPNSENSESDTSSDANAAISSQTGQSDKADNKKTNSSLIKVHFIDVGQGDSILIESGNKYMLIDAGERNKGSIVIDYLETIGVKKLDYIVATHPHSDHIGGLADVINHFNIGKIIMPNAVHTSKTYENLLDTISEKGLKITKAIPGNEYNIGDASFIILAPNGTDYDNLNNYSVVIKLINGNNSFIFAGDAEVQSENEMLKNGLNINADVLKLGHHGSSTSSSAKFLDAVTPDMAIISVGEGNQYGHPDAETLKSIKDREIKLFRTDKQGTIILESDGIKITANKDPYNINDADINTTKSDKSTYNSNSSSTDKTKADTVKTSTNKTETSKSQSNNTGKSSTSKTDTNKSDSSNKNTESAKNIIVHITNTGSKYHRAGCRHLSKSDIEVTLEEALNKGLTPCKTCNPPTM